jgi:hypothetical protein
MALEIANGSPGSPVETSELSEVVPAGAGSGSGQRTWAASDIGRTNNMAITFLAIRCMWGTPFISM